MNEEKLVILQGQKSATEVNVSLAGQSGQHLTLLGGR